MLDPSLKNKLIFVFEFIECKAAEDIDQYIQAIKF